MNDDIAKLREAVEAEYQKVCDSLGPIHVALNAIVSAGPESDLFGLLEDLEKSVKSARTGGLLGSGAKSHRKALEAYRAALIPDEE